MKEAQVMGALRSGQYVRFSETGGADLVAHMRKGAVPGTVTIAPSSSAEGVLTMFVAVCVPALPGLSGQSGEPIMAVAAIRLGYVFQPVYTEDSFGVTLTPKEASSNPKRERNNGPFAEPEQLVFQPGDNAKTVCLRVKNWAREFCKPGMANYVKIMPRDEEMLLQLLQYGMSPNAAVMPMCVKGWPRGLELLLEAGANLHAAQQYGYTPYMVCWGSEQAPIHLATDKGAHCPGFCPLEHQPEMQELLTKHGCDAPPPDAECHQ